MSAEMRQAFADTAGALLDEDESVAIVLADISEQLFADAAARHPDRVVNVGIREQLALNVGAGLALAGLRPIVHTFASFLVERSFEQIKLGFSHQDVGGVLVSAGASYDVSAGGRTHQAPGDVALIDTLPGWSVHVPGHADELDRLLRDAVAAGGRHYVRSSVRSNAQAVPRGGRSGVTPVGTKPGSTTQVIWRGSAGTVIAVGPMLDNVVTAVAGLDVTVLYMTTVRPFDAEAVLTTLSDGADVVLVEPYLSGTSARCVDEALEGVAHRLLSLGVPRVELRRYGSPEEHEIAYGLDAAGLRRSISGFLGA
jgi:transketolase